ncbi:MAG: DUF1343 domain-containing protein [Eubacteriales bacterium]
MITFGVDHLQEYKGEFSKGRVGLLTNITGRSSKLEDTISLLQGVCEVTALFAPEHGIRGDFGAGEEVKTYIDVATQLPVYSLYGTKDKRFTKEMLDTFDLLVYDIQDIGVRFYTYISTLHHAVEDCGKNGKKLMILDRPNPLGGNVVEGGLLDRAYESFVGCHPMPIRYGLTSGEAAIMINEEEQFGCEIKVVPCKGWKREMLFPQWNKIWISPSLALTNFEATLLYVGTCLIEGTNLSEGRGTAAPFRMIGASYLDAEVVAKELNQENLKGVVATPTWFTPTTSKENGVKCGGVCLHVTDQEAIRPVSVGITLLDIIRKIYPEKFAILPPFREGGRPMLSLLSGSGILLGDWKKEELLEAYERDSEAFRIKMETYYLYE